MPTAEEYGYKEYRGGKVTTKKYPVKGSTPSADANSYGTDAPKGGGAERSNLKGPHDGGSSPALKGEAGYERNPGYKFNSNKDSGDAMPRKHVG